MHLQAGSQLPSCLRGQKSQVRETLSHKQVRIMEAQYMVLQVKSTCTPCNPLVATEHNHLCMQGVVLPRLGSIIYLLYSHKLFMLTPVLRVTYCT